MKLIQNWNWDYEYGGGRTLERAGGQSGPQVQINIKVLDAEASGMVVLRLMAGNSGAGTGTGQAINGSMALTISNGQANVWYSGTLNQVAFAVPAPDISAGGWGWSPPGGSLWGGSETKTYTLQAYQVNSFSSANANELTNPVTISPGDGQYVQTVWWGYTNGTAVKTGDSWVVTPTLGAGQSLPAEGSIVYFGERGQTTVTSSGGGTFSVPANAIIGGEVAPNGTSTGIQGMRAESFGPLPKVATASKLAERTLFIQLSSPVIKVESRVCPSMYYDGEDCLPYAPSDATHGTVDLVISSKPPPLFPEYTPTDEGSLNPPYVAEPPYEYTDPYPDTTEEEGDGGQNGPGPSGGGSGGGGYINPSTGGITTPKNFVWLEADPATITFDETCIGSPTSQTQTIINYGTLDCEIPTLNNPDQSEFVVVGGDNVTLSKDETVETIVWFNPNSVGAADLTYVVHDSNDDEQLTLTYAGTGKDCSLTRSVRLTGDTQSSGDLNFLEVTAGTNAEAKFITVINNGTATLRLTGAALHSGSNAFQVTAVPVFLEPSGSTTVQVDFSPTDFQSYSAVVRVAFDVTADPITGTDESGFAYANVSGTGYDDTVYRTIEFRNGDGDVATGDSFGEETVGKYVERNFTIKNTGNGTVMIDGLGFAPSVVGGEVIFSINEFPWAGFPSTPAELAAGTETPPITMRFTPATQTDYEADLTVVATNNPLSTGSPDSYAVTGSGLVNNGGEPGEPEVPPTPDEEPNADPEGDPSQNTSGVGSACITKTCEIPYLYAYTADTPDTP